MTIIRVVHNKENPYVQLNKQALWNDNISLKAIGLWARCMSRPDDWRFNIVELVKKCKEGRRAVDAAINELIENGYALRLEHWEKRKDGKFSSGGVEYIFFEFPVTEVEKAHYIEEFKKSFRHCGFGNCRNGHIQNSKLLKKEEEPKKEEELKKESSSLPPLAHAAPKDETLKKKLERRMDTSISDQEYEEALKRYKEQPPGHVKNMIKWMEATITNIRFMDTSTYTYEEEQAAKMAREIIEEGKRKKRLKRLYGDDDEDNEKLTE